MNLRALLTVPYARILVASLAVFTLAAPASAAGDAPAVSDGQRDFDWEFGTWHSEVRVLADPLSDTDDVWLRFAGTSAVRPLADRRANVVELDIAGTGGRVQALNMRLYEPQAKRWSLTFVTMRDGLLTPSVYGGFRAGVGEFYGDARPADGRSRCGSLSSGRARIG